MSTSKNRARPPAAARTRFERVEPLKSQDEISMIVRRVMDEIAGERFRELVTEPVRATIDIGSGTNALRAGETPKRSPLLEEAMRGADVLCHRLAELAEQLNIYNDTRQGPPPPTDEAAGVNEPSRSGQIGALLDVLSRCHMVASRLDRELNRLQGL